MTYIQDAFTSYTITSKLQYLLDIRDNLVDIRITELKLKHIEFIEERLDYLSTELIYIAHKALQNGIHTIEIEDEFTGISVKADIEELIH